MKTKEDIYFIERELCAIYSAIGCDTPLNHRDILDFVVSDIDEAADLCDWHSGDVEIAFRRFIETCCKTHAETCTSQN